MIRRLFFLLFLVLDLLLLFLTVCVRSAPEPQDQGLVFQGYHKGYEQVPHIPSSAAEVYLHYNFITELPARVFSHLKQCTYLDLSYNTITDVDYDAFEGLSYIQRMYLANNQITRLLPDVFTPLEQCTKLKLNNNQVTVIENNSLRGLSKLQELYLQYNQISVIEMNALRDLGSLRLLHLWSNSLRHLPANLFSGLAQCSSLDLHSNQISVIEDQAFRGLNKLQKLVLFDNQLRQLDSKWLSVLPRPLTLVLSGSRMAVDPPWECHTLCWLKKEEMAGTITRFQNGDKPKCTEGSWDSVKCSDDGRFLPIPRSN